MKSDSKDHQLHLDQEGDGWVAQCECGKFGIGANEDEVLDWFADHVASTYES